jgi:hypothetical protein
MHQRVRSPRLNPQVNANLATHTARFERDAAITAGRLLYPDGETLKRLTSLKQTGKLAAHIDPDWWRAIGGGSRIAGHLAMLYAEGRVRGADGPSAS